MGLPAWVFRLPPTLHFGQNIPIGTVYWGALLQGGSHLLQNIPVGFAIGYPKWHSMGSCMVVGIHPTWPWVSHMVSLSVPHITLHLLFRALVVSQQTIVATAVLVQ